MLESSSDSLRKMLGKNGFERRSTYFIPRSVVRHARLSPLVRAGLRSRKRYADVGMNTARPCGSVVSKRKLILIYGEKEKKKGRWERTTKEKARQCKSCGSHGKRGEGEGAAQTKTYNGYNARWSMLEFSQGRCLHSIRRAFEKIMSSGCLFAFGYFEDEQLVSSTSNSIYYYEEIDSFLVKIVVHIFLSKSCNWLMICLYRFIFFIFMNAVNHRFISSFLYAV